MEKMKIKKLVAILLAVVLLATLPSGLTTVTAKTVKVKQYKIKKSSQVLYSIRNRFASLVDISSQIIGSRPIYRRFFLVIAKTAQRLTQC